MATTIRFYLDENMQVAIADQLKRRGIDVVTVRDLNLLGDSDINHLKRAVEMGCVLCTYDADYVDFAMSGMEHSGIVFGQHHQHTIGDWVKFLELLCGVYSAEEMQNLVEYL
ncbi:MAG: DUF5615 family PIN-like protein [Chloroflexi bacterium]|nr:DUF5615 family PIN-like protein [Chloroflexota bacterium]